MVDYQDDLYKQAEGKSDLPKPGPIEPEGSRPGRIILLKWLPILVILIYFALSYFKIPILISMGRYLVLSKPPERSDLIVCLAGGNVERGLATADVFNMGLAPRIFIAREELPDGYQELKQRDLDYPENVDLMATLLKGLGVPQEAIIKGEVPSGSTWEEAELVKRLAESMDFKSIIIVTSPTHTRRAYLAFKKFMNEKEYRLFIVPSPYSKFNPENWWRSRKYAKEVLLEYQKLLYYALKNPG